MNKKYAVVVCDDDKKPEKIRVQFSHIERIVTQGMFERVKNQVASTYVLVDKQAEDYSAIRRKIMQYVLDYEYMYGSYEPGIKRSINPPLFVMSREYYESLSFLYGIWKDDMIMCLRDSLSEEYRKCSETFLRCIAYGWEFSHNSSTTAKLIYDLCNQYVGRKDIGFEDFKYKLKDAYRFIDYKADEKYSGIREEIDWLTDRVFV